MKYITTDNRILPKFMKPATAGANAIDLRACINEPLEIYPGEQFIIPCGIKIELDKWNMGMILPRSGKGTKGLVLGNLVGNIDSDYRGEVKVCLWNRGNEKHTIKPMDRVAQLTVVDVTIPNWREVVTLLETDRDEGGFGSTGSS